jgi:hypothetical protein
VPVDYLVETLLYSAWHVCKGRSRVHEGAPPPDLNPPAVTQRPAPYVSRTQLCKL